MKFHEYLKSCRKKYELTQEALVQELYNFDAIFSGLDTRTLSRWESAQTQPTAAKQVKIIHFFKRYSSHLFPCFYNIPHIEKELCRVGIKNLIGKSKEHILNFPDNVLHVDDIDITHVRSNDDLEAILHMPKSLIKGLTSDFFKLSLEHLKKWALYPANMFLVAQSNSQFLGMFFILNLKPQSYKRMLSFELHAASITDEDFAEPGEESSLFLLSFYAYNEKIASLLFIRFYAHLIANQDNIKEIGTTPILEGAKKMTEKIHLSLINQKTDATNNLSAYSASLEEVLINEDVLKVIFQKEDCPQESTD